MQQVQRASELPIFLDLKFHDIPNTVASAVRAVCQLGVYMINVHASGGRVMMEAAVKAADDTVHELAVPRPLIIAVTVLTSMDASDLNETGVPGAGDDHPRNPRVQTTAFFIAEAWQRSAVCFASGLIVYRWAWRRSLAPR